MNLVHASCISLNGVGILIRGPSGSGKSSLCLRLIMENGACLVADDQVVLSLQQNHVSASAPVAIQGMIEVRGLGLVQLPFVKDVKLGLIVDLTNASKIERLPERKALQDRVLGETLPRIQLDPQLPQSASIIRAAMQHFSLG